jgi:hypothetical protein
LKPGERKPPDPDCGDGRPDQTEEPSQNGRFVNSRIAQAPPSSPLARRFAFACLGGLKPRNVRFGAGQSPMDRVPGGSEVVDIWFWFT